SLTSCGWVVCDRFAPPELVAEIRRECEQLQPHYEASEIWVGKEAVALFLLQCSYWCCSVLTGIAVFLLECVLLGGKGGRAGGANRRSRRSWGQGYVDVWGTQLGQQWHV
ncbi:MAG: hypothetical protein ACK55Z_18615, partial [bacterium]